MVAIKNIAIFSAIAACAMAAPAAAPVAEAKPELVVRDESSDLSEDQLKSLLEGLLGVEKRDLTSTVNTLLTLLTSVTTFLGNTLNGVVSLNLSGTSDDLTNLLISVNQNLLQLETTLNDVVPGTGLGALLQKVLINSGLQSVVLNISTFVSTLVARLLNNGDLTPAQKAQLQALRDQISAIYNTIQAKNYSSSLTYLLGRSLSSLDAVLGN